MATERKNALRPNEPTLPKVIPKNWAKIEFGYKQVVLPMEDAVAIMKAMENAISYDDPYGKEVVAYPLRTDIKMNLISDEEVKKARLNYLLGVNDVADNTDT